MVKVTGTNYLRDTKTMALVNVDEQAKNDYIAKSRLLSTQKQEINKVKSEIESIKSDMCEIKELMLQLLSKG